MHRDPASRTARARSAPFALAIVLIAASRWASGDVTPRLFEYQDLFALQWASDPQVSPRSTHVAYVRSRYDLLTDAERRDIWIVDTAQAVSTPLEGGACEQILPRWSPDGERLAYVANCEGGRSEVRVRWLKTDRTVKVTGLLEAPSDLVWSPDGSSLAFVSLARGEDTPAPDTVGLRKPEGVTWAPPLRILSQVNYRFDGRGFLPPGFFHLFVVSANGGSARQLTFGPFNDADPFSWTPLGSLGWSPAGDAIVFSSDRAIDQARDPFNSEVHRISLTDGSLTTLTARRGPDSQPAVSPDGKWIAYTGYDERERSYENEQLYVMDAMGRDARRLTGALDRTVAAPRWAADGRSVYFSFVDRGVTKVGRVYLDGRVQTVAEGLSGSGLDRPYSGGEYSVSRTGTIAFTAGDGTHPSEVAILERGRVRRLTNLNADLIRATALSVPQPLRVVSTFDGRPIDSWIMLPPGFEESRKYPLLLEIHGGPFASYGPVFSSELQLYAAAGFVVVYANPRGSSSYGDEFANLIHHDYPGHDYEDLMSVVDAAIGSGHLDPARLFVTGGSGGGVLTAWIVGKTGRFRAAAVQKPIINWSSAVLTTDAYAFMSRYWFGKMPWEDPQAYWRRSPLSLVGQVTTPTLVMVGEADLRSLPSEAEQFYQALQLRGVPTELVEVPGASHSGLAARPSQQAAEVKAILTWFGEQSRRTTQN